MSTLLMTGILFAFAGFGALSMRRRFEEQLPLAVSLVVIVLYVFGLFNALHAGVYAVLLLAAAALTGQVVLLIRGRMKQFCKQLFTPGTMAFFLIALWLLVSFRGYMFDEWDDFSHWGTAVKNMSIFGAIPSGVAESTISYRDYPPATTLFSWLWTHLSGAFNEEDCQRALNMMMFCFLLPAMREQEWKKPGRAFCMSLFLFILPTVFVPDAYITLQVDTLLGCMLLYVLYAWFLCERTKVVCIGIGCTFMLLPLVKGTGTAMAGVMLAVMAAEVFVYNRKTWISRLRPVIFFAFVLVCGKLSWDALLHIHQVEAVWETGKISLYKTILALVGLGTPRQEKIVKVIMERLALVEFWQTNGTVQLSFVHWMIILVGIRHWMVNSCGGREEKNQLRVVYTVLFIGMVGYILTNLMVSLFLFRNDEALIQKSLPRYLASYMIPLAGWSLLMLMYRLECKKCVNVHIPLCMMTFVLMLTSPMAIIEKTISMGNRNQIVYEERMKSLISQDILDKLDNQKDRVYLVAAEDYGYRYYLGAYQFTPVHIQKGMWSAWPITVKEDNWFDRSAVVYSTEEWSQVLLEGHFTHIYLDAINERFVNDYQSMFEENTVIEEGILYAVRETEQGVKFCSTK